MIERRRFVRFSTLLKALCEIGRGIKRTYEIRNISKDGALVMIDKPLSRGSEINLSVDVPGDNVPIFVSCSVAWQKEDKRKKEKRAYETGVRFTRINDLDKARFLRYADTG